MKAHTAIAARPPPLALPLEGSPTEEAALLGGLHLQEQATERRRELGQFFTPVPVARFMARLARPGRRVRRVLDPGAGSGVLACALLEELPDGAGPVHVDAFEVDHGLARFRHGALSRAQAWLAGRGIEMTFAVHDTDFVRANAACLSTSLFESATPDPYDVAVLNYIYRLRGSLTRAEATGLSAVLGSALLDRYFRVSNGNTQVNATELRALPLPALREITAIGEELCDGPDAAGLAEDAPSGPGLPKGDARCTSWGFTTTVRN